MIIIIVCTFKFYTALNNGENRFRTKISLLRSKIYITKIIHTLGVDNEVYPNDTDYLTATTGIKSIHTQITAFSSSHSSRNARLI